MVVGKKRQQNQALACAKKKKKRGYMMSCYLVRDGPCVVFQYKFQCGESEVVGVGSAASLIIPAVKLTNHASTAKLTTYHYCKIKRSLIQVTTKSLQLIRETERRREREIKSKRFTITIYFDNMLVENTLIYLSYNF